MFYSTPPVYRILGRCGTLIVTRVFAVLVAAIAVQYVVDALMTFNLNDKCCYYNDKGI